MFNLRTSMSGRQYSPGVLIGNWNEDVCLEEFSPFYVYLEINSIVSSEAYSQELLKDFLHKRERGELLIQRAKRIKETLYKKEELSVSADGFIHFGDLVLLVSPDNNKFPDEEAAMRGNLSLAVNPKESDIHSATELTAPCEMSAIRSVAPVGRNTFRILSTEGACMGEPVRYGQNFGLGASGGFPEKMLFVASDHRSFRNMAKKSSLQPVFLTDELTYLASWQATYLDPQLRMEYEGFPVPANTKILIVHSHTNQALAVPRVFWIRTYFGKEFEVNCHTYLDTHRAEEDKNYWVVATGNPSDRSTTMFDRPKPPSEEGRVQNSEIPREICPC